MYGFPFTIEAQLNILKVNFGVVTVLVLSMSPMCMFVSFLMNFVNIILAISPFSLSLSLSLSLSPATLS